MRKALKIALLKLLKMVIVVLSNIGLLGPDYYLYKGTHMSTSMTGDYLFHKVGIQNYTYFPASHYGAKADF